VQTSLTTMRSTLADFFYTTSTFAGALFVEVATRATDYYNSHPWLGLAQTFFVVLVAPTALTVLRWWLSHRGAPKSSLDDSLAREYVEDLRRQLREANTRIQEADAALQGARQSLREHAEHELEKK
jgi:hypothetical protein